MSWRVNLRSPPLLHLLKPSQTKVVSGEAGDNVAVAISIHIVSEHFGATVRVRKRLRVSLPRFAGSQLRGLLKPTLGVDDIQLAISVNVANSEPMTKLFIGDLGGDCYKLPWLKRSRPVDRSVAKETIAGTHKFWPIIAHELHELRGLVGHPIKDLVFLPQFVRIRCPWILIDKRGSARETNGKDILESVAIEIVNPGEEMIGVSLTVLGLGQIDLVLDPEVWPLIPMRSIDKIDFPVVVQVTGCRPFGVVDIADLLGTKRVEDSFLTGDQTKAEANHSENTNRQSELLDHGG